MADGAYFYKQLQERAEHDKYKDKASKLDWRNHTSAAEATVAKATDLKTRIGAFSMPLDWAEIFQEWSGLEAKLRSQLQKMQRYVQSFDDYDRDMSMQAADTKDKFTGARDKVSLGLRRVGMSAALAKAVAEAIVSWFNPNHVMSKVPEPMQTPTQATDMFETCSHPVYLLCAKDNATNPFQVQA